MINLGNTKLLGAAALLLLLTPVAVNAQVDGHATASDGYTAGYMFDVGINAVDCTTDPSDCGQLMVNNSGGMTQFALILPTSLKDNTYGANSENYGGNDKDKDQTFDSLTGSDKLLMDLNGNTLRMDFLHGVTDKSNGPVFISGFTGQEGSPAPGSEPSWALAAATSMEYNYSASSPDGSNAPDHFGKDTDSPTGGDAAMAFWEFQHIYEWKVDNSVWENSEFSIDQVAINEIHLSPKKNEYTDNPPIIDCADNNADDCLPVCDPSTDPNGCNTGCDPSTDPNGCQPPDGVPLPGTVVLLLTGLGILTSRRFSVRHARNKLSTVSSR